MPGGWGLEGVGRGGWGWREESRRQSRLWSRLGSWLGFAQKFKGDGRIQRGSEIEFLTLTLESTWKLTRKLTWESIC